MTPAEISGMKQWVAVRIELEKRLAYCFARMNSLFTARDEDPGTEQIENYRESLIRTYFANATDACNALFNMDTEFIKTLEKAESPPKKKTKETKKNESIPEGQN